jgi:hypothetical protein
MGTATLSSEQPEHTQHPKSALPVTFDAHAGCCCCTAHVLYVDTVDFYCPPNNTHSQITGPTLDKVCTLLHTPD